MRYVLIFCLMLFGADAALAQAPSGRDPKSLAGYWLRMPKPARLSYMVGALAGQRAFCDTQPHCQGQQDPRIDRAMDAMDRLTTDEAIRPLPMMAVAAAALATAANRDPMPALQIGRAMIGELTLDQPPAGQPQPEPAAAPARKSSTRSAPRAPKGGN